MLSTVKRFLAALGVAVLGLSIATPAFATTTTYAFNGLITDFTGSGLPSLIGTAVSGSFTASDVRGPELYDYYTDQSLTVASGIYSLFFPLFTGQTQIENNYLGQADLIAWASDGSPAELNGTPLSSLGLGAFYYLSLVDSTKTALSSNALVTPLVALFGNKTLRIGIYNDESVIGEYTATLSNFAPVPLPAALPLLAVGLGLLGLMSRRRQRHSQST